MIPSKLLFLENPVLPKYPPLLVKVEAVEGSENPLYEHVSRLVRCDQDPWLSFSRVVAENVDIYHKRFRDRLDMVR